MKGRQNTTGTGAAAVMIALAIAGLSVQSQAQDGGEEEKKMEATTATTSSAGEWSSTDTKLANHYIGLLQAEPEFGNVLDLLWKLYEKRDSTQVLLDYIGGAAANDEEGTAKLLHGHLLRKSGDADAAAARYGETLKLQPENVHALRGAAELAATAGKPAKSLAYYNRLIPLLPLPDQLGADIRMRKASMLEDSGDIDAAVDLWLEVLGAFPDDLGLRTEVVGLLLEANRVEGAVSVLREMLSAEDPGLKVFALQELNRLYEFIADFAGAASAAREGLALAHYKHHIYADFFGRLVRLHERFGRLEELEQQLLEDAEKGNPTEESVYVLGEFYRLTANPLKREIWLARLVELVPGNPAYRSDLAHTQIANDHYEAAAKTVDDLLATGAEGDLPLPLVLLRTRIELNLGGKEGAAAYLEKYLQRGEPTGEALRKVLAFSRENYLDGVVEDLLRGPLAEDGLAAKDDAPSAVRLATFLRERGRLKQAKETLEEYVAEAGDDVRRKGQRLEQAAAAYREMDLPDEALEKIRESIALAPDRLDLEVQRAEILVVQQDIKGAMIAYESVWRRSATIEEKTEIDQRLFSLLRGLDDDPSVPSPASMQPPPLGSSPATMAQFRRRQMTAAATLAGGGGGIGPAGAEAVPRELLEFYEGLKKVALEEPTVANRYRVAWWAFRQQDHTEMYHQLAGLHDPDNPILEVEKLMLELAEQTENTLLMARKLELLAQIDIDNQTEYRQRWAEVRFKLGYEDEAVRLLEELASDPDASLSTLKALAGVYKEQARNKDQVEVWRKAYLRGNVFEKRRVIKQLTTTLIEMGEPGQAMAAQMDLIERETDMVQKRKLFDAQLSLANRQYLLGELLETYMELSQQSPFERFYPEALARIYRAMDDSDAAFKAMKKAYYMSGEDRELLAELGEMAGETSDLKAAIYYRRQLISKDDGEGTDAESWKALIGMLERDLRVQEADRIRRRLEGKFAQDADFLQSMAEYYQSTGQGVSAARVLEELVRLRPWDGQAQLELGLLRRDAGDLKGALAAFESTIEATAEAALSAQERDFEYLPLVDGGWYSGVGTRPVNGGLSNIVRGMQDYHYTPLDLQEEMLNRFQRPHPEFHRVPGGDSFLRLRAIEEAARLVAAGVGIEVAEGAEGPSATDVEDARDAWVRRWDRSGEVSPTERLWAFFHVGDHLAAHRLLKERMLPVFRAPDQFDFLYLSLRMGRHQEVIDWLKEERLKPAEDQGDPSTLPMIATFLLLREGQDEEAQLSDEVLVALLGELTVSPRLLDHLVEQLMHNGTIGSAYRLASAALSTEAVGVDIDRCYRASKLAHWLGMEQQREEWLVRAVEVMALRPVRSGRTFSAGWVLPATFYQVTAERMSLLEAGAQRDEFRSGVMAQLEKMPGVGEDMILEAEALLAFADGEAQKGMGFLARLMARRSSGGRSRELVEDSRTDSIFRREFWMLSERIVNQLAMTVPHGAPSGAFYAAFQPLAQRSRSGDEEVDAQFEQFEIARFAWLLEGMAPAERLSRVALFSDGLLDESSRMELVHTLESRGFYRDVVPLYDRLIAEQPDDFTLVRGFFQACREARDHEAGLEMLGRFLNGELPRAAGMTDGYLVTEHAHFLEMARDVEQLATFAQSSGELIGKGDAGDAEGDTTAPLSPAALLAKVRVAGGFSGETGGAGDWSGVYHAALARVQEQRGDTDAALRVYEHLRQKEILDLGDRLEAVDLLIVEGKYEEARSWLADVSFDRIQPGVEANALRKLVQLNAREGQRDVEKLEALARTALDYGDVDLVGDVAATLHEAGLAAEADSLLLLRARQAQSAQERSRLLLRMLIVAPETESKLKSGTEPVSVAWVSRSEESRKAALLVLLDTLQPEDPATLEWLTAVKALAADDGGGGGGGADADAMRVQLQEMAVEMASNSLPLELAGLLLETDRDAVDVRGRVANWSVAGRELAALVLPEESVWMEALGESLAAESVVPQLFSSPGDLQRRIQVLARLGLDEQLENLHRHLLLETAGGGLLRRMAVDEALTFELRWPLPAVFAESGRRDLAADLYRHYFEALPRLTRGHGEFLDGYARFLIEEKRWVDAENLLQLLFQKSLGGDTQLLVELFDGQTGSSEEAAADDAGDWQQFLKKFSLSSGEMVDLAARREN